MGIFRALVGSRIPEKYHRFLDLPDRPESFRFAHTSALRLGAMSAAWREDTAGASAVYRLKSGREALGARLALIDAAEVSIDIQSYLIRFDTSGTLLALRLIEAARRGVRVRLLMDDALTLGSDDGLTVLDGHEGIEVRVFNPFPRHRSRVLSFLLNFNILNRRMHNKSFTVDNAVTIVGGRNIADEYYQTHEDAEFIDEDVLATGRVADEVSRSFDEYWNAREACPVSFLKPELSRTRIDEIIERGRKRVAEPRAAAYAESLDRDFALRLIRRETGLHAATASAVYDSPEKIRAILHDGASRTTRYLQQLVSGAESEVVIVSPYFVPQRQGVDFLSALVRTGVRVVVITNSLASTNHSSVHAVYARYRKPLLRQGIELYELSSLQPDQVEAAAAMKVTLHSKVAIVDRARIYVGSFNLDPRSVFLNTEMGLGIDCSELGEEMAVAVSEGLPSVAYQLGLDKRERLTWRRSARPGSAVYRTEPETRLVRRWLTRAMGLLPIEGQM